MHANMQEKTCKYAKSMQIYFTLIDIKNYNYNLEKIRVYCILNIIVSNKLSI